MGIYEDNRDREIGRQAQINAQATRKGSQMADEQRRQEDMQQRAMMEQEMQQQQGQEQAYQAGQQNQQQTINDQVNDMLAQRMAQQVNSGSGLGIGSQTIDAIQNEDSQRQQAMQEAAMQFMQEVEGAKQQGAPAEYIQEMYAKVPPELRGAIQSLQQQQMQRNAPQDQGMY